MRSQKNVFYFEITFLFVALTQSLKLNAYKFFPPLKRYIFVLNNRESIVLHQLWTFIPFPRRHFQRICVQFTQKTEIFKTTNSQKFFEKISGIGSLVSKIDCCEGHWCCSTYMVVRLLDVTSKPAQTTKNAFLACFRAVSQPYRLSHIDALSVNQFY